MAYLPYIYEGKTVGNNASQFPKLNSRWFYVTFDSTEYAYCFAERTDMRRVDKVALRRELVEAFNSDACNAFGKLSGVFPHYTYEHKY